ncbi:MAG: hypothetical protein WCX17_03585 [Parcubacteria group bacterium]|jgi:hypothetical protein
MPKIKEVVDDLVASYGLRENISEKEYGEILADYNRQAYGKCVAKIRNLFKLSMVKFIITYVDSDEASRWISLSHKNDLLTANPHLSHNAEVVMRVEIPENMPLYGTSAFSRLAIKLDINKNDLSRPFDVFLLDVAHEMAHIVLYSTRNPWRYSEKATDIFVLLKGFVDINERAHAIGLKSYLSPDEVRGISWHIRKKQEKQGKRG